MGDEMSAEARLCEEKASKAMVDAAKLADELRAEQEGAQGLERGRKLGESQLKDMQGRFDEAETNALKGGKKAVNKLDTRIRELESELDAENRRFDDARKNHQRMQSLVDQLQGKIKAYKKQIEEAEEIAALNLAKFRKVQGALSEAEARADLNESALAKSRARGGSVPH